MKNYFKLLLFAVFLPLVVVSLAFTFKESKKEKISKVVVLEGIDKVSGVTREVIKLDTVQNSQCDTCYSNYVSAIRENREVSQKIADKNLELHEKYLKALLLEKSLDSLNSVLETEKKRIVGTLNRITKKENKRE